MSQIKDILLNMKINDIIDIIIVAFVVYKIFFLIRETRAEQLLKGILVIVGASALSTWFNLHATSYILKQSLNVGVIAILIVFQPELRKALERLGSSRFFIESFVEAEEELNKEIVAEILEALASLSRQNIGALLVFERETGLNEIVETGTKINGRISSQLLINIFIPKTPLHDGAVIVKRDVIKAAGCLLPLSESKIIKKDLGTRHRAGLGISENSDALTIVVSEETGHISFTDDGKLYRNISMKRLEKIINTLYFKKEKKQGVQGVLQRWWNKNE